MARHPLISGRRRILDAIGRWREAGLIDAATADRLLAAETKASPGSTGRLAMAAFGFGGLLLAAGVFLFVAANWQELSPGARFAIVLAMVAALHVAAAAGARFSASLATSLHAVGTAALGAGIFLAGQIFNLQEHWPEAFLLWALGAAVAAGLLRDWPQVLWTAVLAPAWLVAEWYANIPWYRAVSGAAIESVVPFGLVVLCAAYLAAPSPTRDAAWRQALAALGAVGLILTAASLGSRDLAFVIETLQVEPVPAALLAIGWAVAIALPLSLAFAMRRAQAWPVGVAAVLAGIVIALDPGVTWQRLAIYLVYALGSVGLVAWGVRERQRLRINVGILGFVLTLLAFYFSSLFDMLGRALGLIGMGLLCILGGWLAERTRRRLIARMEVHGS